MSATLILNAGTASPITVVVQQAGENAPTEIGTVGQSFNGADQSSVRAIKRNLGALTTFVDTATKDSIINLLKNGRQLPCSGELLADIQTQCTMRYTGARMIPGLPGFWEVGLTGNEVQPNNVLLRYSPGDTITGESFSRSTTATYFNANGILASAAINVKRDSHYQSAGRSLLLEGSRTNRFLWPEDLSNAVWVKSGTTISANAAVAPDGATTGDKIQEDGTNAAHFVFQAITYTAGTGQSFLFYAKAAERTWLYIRSDCAGAKEAWVNLSTGALGTVDANLTIRVSGLTNGWFQIELTQATGITGTAGELCIGPATGNNANSYTGTVGSGIYAWGAQHERDAPFPSSYIPTTSAEVTRGADFYSLPHTAPPQELTVYEKFLERGTKSTSNGFLWMIGSAAVTSPRIEGYSTGSFYRTYHEPTAITGVHSTLAVAPTFDDSTELAHRLFGDGSADITQSIAGAAATAGAQSAALAMGEAWSGQLVWLNSSGTNDTQSFTALQSFKIVAGSRSLEEMRAA